MNDGLREQILRLLAEARVGSRPDGIVQAANLIDIHGSAEDSWATPSCVALLGQLLEELRSADVGRRFIGSELAFYVARALGALGDRSTVEVLVTALQSEDRRLALFAAGALGDIADRRAFEPLLVAAQEGNERAVEALGGMRLPGTLTALLPMLVSIVQEPARPRKVDEGSPPLFLALLDTVGRLGDSEAAQVLRPLLERRDREVRLRAAQALSRLGDQQGDRVIHAALAWRDRDLRWIAARRLVELTDRRGLPMLLRIYQGDDVYQRNLLLRNLARQGEKADLPLLLWIAEHGEEQTGFGWSLSTAAMHASRRIQERQQRQMETREERTGPGGLDRPGQ